MSVMFLLNPPKKMRNNKVRRMRRNKERPGLIEMRYPSKMGVPAKKHLKPSITMGGRVITRAVREALGLDKGERPVKHRVTFWSKKGKRLLLRSPKAVLKNKSRRKTRKLRKGVKLNMARRRHHKSRRSHRKVRHNPIANVKRSHRRRSHRKVRAIALFRSNPVRRSHRRRHHRNSPLALLTNPLRGITGKLKGAMGPLGQAAGIYGGYVGTNIATNYLWNFDFIKNTAFFKENEKYMRPVTQAAVAIGLSYAVKRWLPLKQKDAIAKAILIGGMFAAVKNLVVNVTKGIEAFQGKGFLPETVAPALGDTDGFTYEPLRGYTEEAVESPLSGVGEEGDIARFAARY